MIASERVGRVVTITLDGTRANARDGLAIRNEERLRITALEDAEIVLVDSA